MDLHTTGIMLLPLKLPLTQLGDSQVHLCHGKLSFLGRKFPALLPCRPSDPEMQVSSAPWADSAQDVDSCLSRLQRLGAEWAQMNGDPDDEEQCIIRIKAKPVTLC